jgi:CrcB protein
MISTLIQVALGGAIGAAARFGVGAALFRPGGGFPVGVLAVNVIGSFLMGLVVVYLGQKMLSHLNPFLMTGVLGGFTTFSAFSLEVYTLFERGEVGQAALYVALSVILSIAALVAGIFIMRGVLA